jgi:hypothetical protein
LKICGAAAREALAGTFNAQGVANTLWAHAMVREPGAGLMRELEGRAELVAGTFNAQTWQTLCWLLACFPFYAPLGNKFDRCIDLCSA